VYGTVRTGPYTDFLDQFYALPHLSLADNFQAHLMDQKGFEPGGGASKERKITGTIVPKKMWGWIQAHRPNSEKAIWKIYLPPSTAPPFWLSYG
jgi:hypothetical protein